MTTKNIKLFFALTIIILSVIIFAYAVYYSVSSINLYGLFSIYTIQNIIAFIIIFIFVCFLYCLGLFILCLAIQRWL